MEVCLETAALQGELAYVLPGAVWIGLITFRRGRIYHGDGVSLREPGRLETAILVG